ncbi:MAG: PHP domain-containing protein [Ferrimicrobium sp.]
MIRRFHVDLHVHTFHSGDSVTSLDDIVAAVLDSDIEWIAITDHHSIQGALELASILKDQVIIGEEIATGQGELIGLFLTERIPPLAGLTITAKRIRDQGGLVYVPHVGDPTRRSINLENLELLAQHSLVDLIEVGNSKMADINHPAVDIATRWEIPSVASSDSHVASAIGSSSTQITANPYELTSQSLYQAASTGTVHYQHCDPTRIHTSQILPSTMTPQ